MQPLAVPSKAHPGAVGLGAPRCISLVLLGLGPGELISSSPLAGCAGSCLLLSEELLSISKEIKPALFPSLD